MAHSPTDDVPRVARGHRRHRPRGFDPLLHRRARLRGGAVVQRRRRGRRGVRGGAAGPHDLAIPHQGRLPARADGLGEPARPRVRVAAAEPARAHPPVVRGRRHRSRRGARGRRSARRRPGRARASTAAMSSTSNDRWVSPRWFRCCDAHPWTGGLAQPISSSRNPPLVRYREVMWTGGSTSDARGDLVAGVERRPARSRALRCRSGSKPRRSVTAMATCDTRGRRRWASAPCGSPRTSPYLM